ncbi:unnamed protein product [Psylliodes chrysocephalus]|uniref:Uncharacterized protein n=1 Tax=Psylliodes chrysocephalus TaxID=3402493 RepID=A0A9P0CEA1_9CUCU|nr:unnamed protein product [Psylliodes chrysocephala]
MKVLVLLALVALCYSSPLTAQKRVTVIGDDITIVGNHGSEIVISKSVIDPTKVNIILKSQNGITKKIQVDETANIKNVNFNILDARFFKNIPKEQITQADILTHIFREYQGLVDEPTYQILLGKIQALVQQGYLHEAILESLTTLDQLHMVEQIKQVEAKNVMSNIVSQKLHQNVYPVGEVSQLPQVSGVVPVENVHGLNQYQNNLPILKNSGIQGLWNIGHLSPYQQQVLLQQIKQNIQYQQGLQGQEYMPVEILGNQQQQQQQQIMEQIYQHQIGQSQLTPLNRFLYNMGVLKGQGYYYPQVPQQLTIPQIQGQYQYQHIAPQNQYVNQQQIQNMVQSGQNHVQYPYQQIPQYSAQQKVNQQQIQNMEQLVQNHVQYPYHQIPQYYAHQQVYPQGYVQQEVLPQVEQALLAHQQNVYQQYGYGKVPMVY